LNVQSKKDPNNSYFFFVGKNKLANQEENMNNIYSNSKDADDNFLYILYSDSETFGSILWLIIHNYYKKATLYCLNAYYLLVNLVFCLFLNHLFKLFT